MAGTQRDLSLYIIAYDISDDKRRTKVHKILSGFGKWTQYSLFECFLTAKQKLLLQHKLSKHLRPEEDSVRFYYVCEGCLRKVETVGGQKPEPERLFLV